MKINRLCLSVKRCRFVMFIQQKIETVLINIKNKINDNGKRFE